MRQLCTKSEASQAPLQPGQCSPASAWNPAFYKLLVPVPYVLCDLSVRSSSEKLLEAEGSPDRGTALQHACANVSSAMAGPCSEDCSHQLTVAGKGQGRRDITHVGETRGQQQRGAETEVSWGWRASASRRAKPSLEEPLTGNWSTKNERTLLWLQKARGARALQGKKSSVDKEADEATERGPGGRGGSLDLFKREGSEDSLHLAEVLLEAQCLSRCWPSPCDLVFVLHTSQPALWLSLPEIGGLLLPSSRQG
ncbi:hypothetical protein TREES_T100012262 [Tupaia chinensis]|uniref:Uncharacterized protein n=1 Tax=Tupaia chinensis TaxID=246437 RepID=L9JJI1_TUPCH|nr:hypothetical protein TREES_T100012262 [Tupaia chinensis]